MYPTYDMNPIAIREMAEERLAALEDGRRLSIAPLLPAFGSISILVVAAIALV